jgi:galactokinase
MTDLERGDMKQIDLFVPGRLCLFGEHSDWAGGFRKTDPSVSPGHCMIIGTDQGISARCRVQTKWFDISSRLPGDDRSVHTCRIPFTRESLNQTASSPGFARYAAGVAFEIHERYPVSGLHIDAYDMTLPLKKGLSSSAAICVLVARCFNQLYDLNLDIREEMELAYLGEIRTGSQCGRMDQACAYGKTPTSLTFDGEDMTVSPLHPAKELHLMIVDLKGEKDTVKILSDLNRHFQDPEGLIGHALRHGLGSANTGILREAVQAMETGNARHLGDLMVRAQRNFDENVMPACPDELRAPKLHAVLNHRCVNDLSEGGKGVGSQGDGCAQFVCTDPDRRLAFMRRLTDDLNVECFVLDIPVGQPT